MLFALNECKGFPHSNKIEKNLAVKQVSVNLGSSVELESPMLHAKFQDHRTSGAGKEDV